jgi:hypothetical protein
LTGVEYITATLLCILFSNWRTWRAGMQRGINGTLEDLKNQGVFDYLDEPDISKETI